MVAYPGGESAQSSWKQKRRLELLPGRLLANGEPPTSAAPSSFVRTPVHRHKQDVGESFPSLWLNAMEASASMASAVQ